MPPFADKPIGIHDHRDQIIAGVDATGKTINKYSDFMPCYKQAENTV
jgi:hypothetical protein